ncbi:MAG: ABC transporter ATP-binding protein [Chloroherpetonaceae bacterium]|nr:ABC transporter ATP-binding protein [Chloroherpetonaceae bacterium]
MSIEINNVVMKYHQSREPLLKIPQFSIESGAKIALVGRSGSGKSTLLNLIAGILKPTEGTIKVLNEEITSLSESQRDAFRAKSIGYVFQSFNLLQGFSAKENILLAMKFGSNEKNKSEKAALLLDTVGLSDKADKKPRELSVGEQQRVAIVRAIANDPKIILADEPTANLDEENTRIVLELLFNLTAQTDRTLILVTHEKEVAERFPTQLNLKTIIQKPQSEPAL